MSAPAAFSSRFQVPSLPQRKPMEPFGTTILSVAVVIADRLPVRVGGLAQRVGEVVGAQHAARHQPAVALVEAHQHRHVGVLAGVVLEIGHLAVDVELAQDHMAHRHGQRAVGAGARAQPDVAELRGFRIVRADHRRLRPAIARLGIEMGIRRARLRHVGAPQDQEAGVVPVGAFRHVGLLAPGLGRGRRQVAVPVVERHAGAAEQAQVARAGGIGHHRHGRDRREAEHAVGPVFLAV
jgi:hypothetical protein